MQKHFFLTLLISFLFGLASFAGTVTDSHRLNIQNEIIPDTADIDDGPYIFINENKIIEKKIINGKVITKESALNSMITEFTPEEEVYTNIKKIAVFSDIHGQYDTALEILINNKVINKNLEWTFGKGHLVIVGDIFDRGDKVTEMLWFIFFLEKQAKKKGGKVHYLTGNHEYMVLHNDIRYIHNKYKLSSQLLNTAYPELYGKNTLLGRWLRSKHAVIKINDILFSHAGISEEFLSEWRDISGLNNFMRNAIDVPKQEKKADSVYRSYFGSNGPIWYRGYFKEDMNEKEIENILNRLNIEHIIVGHTTLNQITSLFNAKVIAVDSGIKYGKKGELLLIKNDKFYRCLMTGEKIPIE